MQDRAQDALSYCERIWRGIVDLNWNWLFLCRIVLLFGRWSRTGLLRCFMERASQARSKAGQTFYRGAAHRIDFRFNRALVSGEISGHVPELRAHEGRDSDYKSDGHRDREDHRNHVRNMQLP